MHYTLIVGGKTISADGEESVLSSWSTTVPSGTHRVQFGVFLLPRTLCVYV